MSFCMTSRISTLKCGFRGRAAVSGYSGVHRPFGAGRICRDQLRAAFVDETWMANGAMLRRVSRPASIGPLSTLHPYQEDSHRGGVNIVALRRWIKLKARRRF